MKKLFKKEKVKKLDVSPKKLTLPKTKKPVVKAEKKVKKNGEVKGIKARLLSSYTVVIAVSLVASIVALIMLGINGASFGKFFNENYQVTVESWEVMQHQRVADDTMKSAMLETDTKLILSQVDEAIAQIEETKEMLKVLKAHSSVDDAMVDKLLTNYDSTADALTEMRAYTLLGNKKHSYEVMKTSYEPIIDEIYVQLEELVAQQEVIATKQVTSANIMVVVGIVLVVVLAGASAFIATALGKKIAKSISDPIDVIEGAAKKLAAGELDIEIAYNKKDELGKLADSMRATCAFIKDVISDIGYLLKEISEGNFVVNSENEAVYIGDFNELLTFIGTLKQELSSTLIEIDEAAEQVTAGAGQMAEGAQALAEGATDQAGAVEELTAMIGSVAETSMRAANTAKETYQQAIDYRVQAEAGQEEMTKLLDAMDRINETSKQIEKIIGEIEDIASQTNLLSLNASIEAARAGEAGRGFAVVADQIGKLAADSAKSAEHTRKLIKNSMDEIQNGNVITNRTSEALERVVEGINVLAQSVQEVSDQSLEQVEAIKEVEAGVSQISMVIENNSASAEESSATSQELSAQADSLKALVGRFRLQ